MSLNSSEPVLSSSIFIGANQSFPTSLTHPIDVSWELMRDLLSSVVDAIQLFMSGEAKSGGQSAVK